MSKPNITAEEVAAFILDRAAQIGELITNLRLQKLLYYAQAWHLANYGKPLFDDDFEAWVHGPVIPSIYKKYQASGNGPIGDVK